MRSSVKDIVCASAYRGISACAIQSAETPPIVIAAALFMNSRRSMYPWQYSS